MMQPCKGCPDRTATPNCHSRCEKYKIYREEWDKFRESMRQEEPYKDYMRYQLRVDKKRGGGNRCE